MMSAQTSQELIGFKKPDAPASKERKGELALLREQLAEQQKQSREQLANRQKTNQEQVAGLERQLEAQRKQSEEQRKQSEEPKALTLHTCTVPHNLIQSFCPTRTPPTLSMSSG